MLEVILLGFGFFLFPFSEHSFLINAANSLFYARTFRDDIFKEDKNPMNVDTLIRKGVISNEEASEIKTHKKVDLTTRDTIFLFIKRRFQICFKNKYWNKLTPKDEQLIKLCDIAASKIESDLNVVKIIKHLRETRVLAVNTHMNDVVKF